MTETNIIQVEKDSVTGYLLQQSIMKVQAPVTFARVKKREEFSKEEETARTQELKTADQETTITETATESETATTECDGRTVGEGARNWNCKLRS